MDLLNLMKHGQGVVIARGPVQQVRRTIPVEHDIATTALKQPVSSRRRPFTYCVQASSAVQEEWLL